MRTLHFLLGPCILTVLFGVPSAAAGPPDHGFHPPMPDQRLYFQCTLAGADAQILVEEGLRLPSASAPAPMDQIVALPAPRPPIRLKQYLPKASLEQEVVPDKSGKGRPAIQIAIEGATQSYNRWLLAGQPERDRLTSFIGTWRYVAVANEQERDELHRQFAEELTRKPKLIIHGTDGDTQKTVPCEKGRSATIKELGCRIRVLEFYPHYGLDLDAKKPVNRSEKRLNPAALIEIEQNGKTEQRWVFGKFPQFQAEQGQGLPIEIRLDCPLHREQDRPDFVIVTVNRTRHELWSRHAGKQAYRKIDIGEKANVGGARYTFHVAKFTPSGRLVEAYRKVSGKGGVTALQIEFTDASGARTPLWLELGKPRVISTAQGPLTVAFGPRQADRPAKGHAARSAGDPG